MPSRDIKNTLGEIDIAGTQGRVSKSDLTQKSSSIIIRASDQRSSQAESWIREFNEWKKNDW